LDSGTRHTRVGRQFLRLRDLLRIFGETGGKRKGSRAHGSIQNTICIPMINIAVHPHAPTYNVYIHTHTQIEGREIGHIRRTPQCPPLRKILCRPYALLSEHMCVFNTYTYIYIICQERKRKWKIQNTILVCFGEVHNDTVWVLVWIGGSVCRLTLRLQSVR